MFAVIRDGSMVDAGKAFVITLHENDGMPHYKREEFDSIEEAKASVAVAWRKPTEDDEATGDVLFLGN